MRQLLVSLVFVLISVRAHAMDAVLTFDDGPSPLTARVLTILEREHVCATFFYVGNRMRAYRRVALAVKASCSEIENHSYDHPHLRIARMSESAVEREFARGGAAIRAVVGYTPHYARVPGCGESRAITAALRHLGLPQVACRSAIDPADYRNPSPETIAERVLAHAKPDVPILLHPELHPNTVRALPMIIEGLRKRGLDHFITVRELYAKHGEIAKR